MTSRIRASLPSSGFDKSELIRQLKRETIQHRKDTKALQTKVALLRDKVNARDSAISKVFTQTKDQQKLATASQNMIQGLSSNIKTLNNNKKAMERQYAELTTSDRFFHARELQNEILVLFQELERFKANSNEKHEKRAVLVSRIANIDNALSVAQCQKEETPVIQEDTRQFMERVMTYIKGKQKVVETEIIARVNEDFNRFNQEKAQIDQQITQLTQELDQINTENAENEKTFCDSVSQLDLLIDDAIQRIKQGPADPSEENEAQKQNCEDEQCAKTELNQNEEKELNQNEEKELNANEEKELNQNEGTNLDEKEELNQNEEVEPKQDQESELDNK